MPTILPKTYVQITRVSQNLTNPADAVVETTAEIYAGMASVEDASGSGKLNSFFPEGTQYAKTYLVYCEPTWGVKTNDIIEFNESLIGSKEMFLPDVDTIKMKIIIPKRIGALKILGSRHIEAFCVSNN